MTAYLDAHQMPGAISETRFDNWYAGFNDWVHVFRNEISFFHGDGALPLCDAAVLYGE
jgi:hypothetical protein